MLRTLLVPLDGSPFAEHALPYALAVARRTGATIHLIHAHDPGQAEWAVPDIVWDEEIRDREQEYVERVAETLREAGADPASATVVVGDPVAVIGDRAHRIDADMIVMTTHGRGGLSRSWLGSVADGLVRTVGIPILLVRPGAGAVELDREVSFDRILVPLDGSELSEQIIPSVLDLAQPGRTRITLLRVLPPSLTIGGHVFQLDAARLAQLEEQAESYLEGVAERLRGRSIDVETVVLADPAPAAAITGWVVGHDIDLIAMTTHGRAGVARLVLGNVADKVLRSTLMPILLYRPQSG